jgi:ubiquinone/menaquinone biosynthesis C-methylase UbiE
MLKDKRNDTIAAIQRFTTLADKEALEIGCGAGRVTAHLARLCHRMEAVDPDAAAIDLARAAVPEATFHVAPGERLPQEDDSFDLVIFTLSLHHHDEPKVALAQAIRVLKPGGRILVIEPVPGGELEKLCCAFNDETDEVTLAQAAIRLIGLEVERDEIFEAVWEFEDLNEMLTYFFEYHRMEYHPPTAERVQEMLGDKAGHIPLVLDDVIRIQLLRNG